MAGNDWTCSNHVYKPGDPCWIIVDDVNSPTGCWRGQIVEFNERPGPDNGYVSISAKITDPRAEKESKYGLSYLGRSPTVNYSVVPSNPHIDKMFEWIQRLEKEAEAVRYRAAVREGAFKDAIAAAASATKTTINVEAIVEQAVSKALEKR